MTTLISILAQTKTGAIIEIIVLLLIAGCIAYLTAYYYYKSIYLKKIKSLEEEKSDMANKISDLQDELIINKKETAKLKKDILVLKGKKEKEKK